MPVERFFVDSQLMQNEELTLSDQEFHHLAHVTRAKVGDIVELVNGRGALASAQVKRIEKKQAILKIEDAVHSLKPSVEVILAQAIPRINRLDFILEKGTELGMSQIWLFPASQSERKELTQHQIERMRTITVSAIKQCGRLYLPEIVLKPPLAQWKKPEQLSFFGDLDPSAPFLNEIWRKEAFIESVLFYIGPESGFTSDEIIKLCALGATGVRLHANILRADTAALAALSILMHQIL